MSDRCQNCGVKWVDHPGIAGTCERLERMTMERDALKTELAKANEDYIAIAADTLSARTALRRLLFLAGQAFDKDDGASRAVKSARRRAVKSATDVLDAKPFGE